MQIYSGWEAPLKDFRFPVYLRRMVAEVAAPITVLGV